MGQNSGKLQGDTPRRMPGLVQLQIGRAINLAATKVASQRSEAPHAEMKQCNDQENRENGR